MTTRAILYLTAIGSLCLVLLLPSRVLLELNDSFYAERTDGFWWKGEIPNLYFKNELIGDAYFRLSFVNIFKGNLMYNLKIKRADGFIYGKAGVSIKGDFILQDTDFSVQFKNNGLNQYAVSQSLFSIEGLIKNFEFNNLGCVKSSGNAAGKMLNEYGLFTQDLILDITLECKDGLTALRFNSKNKDFLTGFIHITPDLKYEIQVKSSTLASKISNLTKANFTSRPIFQSSGYIKDVLANL